MERFADETRATFASEDSQRESLLPSGNLDGKGRSSPFDDQAGISYLEGKKAPQQKSVGPRKIEKQRVGSTEKQKERWHVIGKNPLVSSHRSTVTPPLAEEGARPSGIAESGFTGLSPERAVLISADSSSVQHDVLEPVNVCPYQRDAKSGHCNAR